MLPEGEDELDGVAGLLPPCQTPPFQEPPLLDDDDEEEEPLPVEPLEWPLPEDELEPEPELGLPGHEAGQPQDGVHVLLDWPLPWQTFPASDGTDGHLSTPSRIATPMPPEK